MAWASANATPIRSKDEAFDTKAFATAPSNPEDLQRVSREIAACLTSASNPKKS